MPTPSTKHLRTESTIGIADKLIDHVLPRRVSILPVEVLDNILRFLTRNELISLLPVNKFFYAISARQLYHTITLRCARQSIALFQTILNNATVPPLVRSLDIELSNSHPLKAFYCLFQKVLQRLPALVALFLDFPKCHSPLWIFQGCTFSLKSFTTSMYCTLPLAQFLDTQPSITDLTLRGFQSDNLSMLPFLDIPDSGTKEEEQFKLKPTSLPKLTHFNAIHAGAPVIQAVVEDRPVEVVSIPLFPSLSMDSLLALKSSSVPMRRLSLISFDPEAPHFLFQVLSDGFAQLEALHVVFLMTDYTKELLEQSGNLLRHFKSLKYITFMAASGDETTAIDESVIAKQWHSSCPTLKTIILPKGRVWFQGTEDKTNPDWDCLPDSETTAS
ncbi:hypothetical protein BYT27DRAFT_7194799 [Phlegmacium glaucopus]|nr:hypothetical protein BYT27DRAFT_7194799 [Phlegmacium glaucopus]